MAQLCFPIPSIRSILVFVWAFICRHWHDEDDYSHKDAAKSSSDTHLTLEVDQERKQLLPPAPERDDPPLQQDADRLQCPAPALKPARGGRASSEAAAADPSLDSGPIDHFADASTDIPIDGYEEREDALMREAAQFWKLCPETHSWYHKDKETGEVIWAPYELD
ncbi:uncharacterized protein DNG_07610 [Cephalotrichum gorgonifer]|uniref:WW domain-containing protein n=1 Tax=Cephalotrichum gorgonifer TaxID=2041049 RepID=A0AAE8N235_9PEZI|nr:uncharacterized protein DNG_07610 [Cephalotrichum gorgonifer]